MTSSKSRCLRESSAPLYWWWRRPDLRTQVNGTAYWRSTIVSCPSPSLRRLLSVRRSIVPAFRSTFNNCALLRIQGRHHLPLCRVGSISYQHFWQFYSAASSRTRIVSFSRNGKSRSRGWLPAHIEQQKRDRAAERGLVLSRKRYRR
jgi:hypothetical protein